MLPTRRDFLIRTATALPPLLISGATSLGGEDRPVTTATTITEGDLKVVFRDNSQSPRVLSGVASLVNRKAAPGFDAIDPDSPGAAAGLNFEHIISDHKSQNNAFTPRRGKISLHVLPDGKSVSSCESGKTTPGRCRAESSTRWRSLTSSTWIFAALLTTKPSSASGATPFFSSPTTWTMCRTRPSISGETQVHRPAREVDRRRRPERSRRLEPGRWYRSSRAADLDYDADHNFKLNSWSYEWPRFTQPFYYGRAARDMVFMLMFNKMFSGRKTKSASACSSSSFPASHGQRGTSNM